MSGGVFEANCSKQMGQRNKQNNNNNKNTIFHEMFLLLLEG